MKTGTIGSISTALTVLLAIGCGVDESLLRNCQLDQRAMREDAQKARQEADSCNSETRAKDRVISGKDQAVLELQVKVKSLEEKVKELEGRLSQAKASAPPVAALPCREEGPVNADAVRGRLLELVRQQQRSHVRRSNKETDCFTDLNLRSFVGRDVPGQVATKVKAMDSFRKLARQFHCLTAEQRDGLVAEAKSTFAPTWGELVKITPRGQTDAGQTAERLIAEGIAAALESAQP